MAEEFVERRQCPEHSGEYARSCMNAENIKKVSNDLDAAVIRLAEEIAKKTPMWTFIPLIGILLAILSVQYATYTQMGEYSRNTEKRLSIAEERLGVVRETLQRYQCQPGKP